MSCPHQTPRCPGFPRSALPRRGTPIHLQNQGTPPGLCHECEEDFSVGCVAADRADGPLPTGGPATSRPRGGREGHEMQDLLERIRRGDAPGSADPAAAAAADEEEAAASGQAGDWERQRWYEATAAGYRAAHREVVAAACAVARRALPACEGYDAAPDAGAVALAAIEAAERWCRGEATIEQVGVSGAAAWRLAFRGDDASGAALMAAGYAAHAVLAPALALAKARWWAAEAAAYAAGGALIASQAGAADARAARVAARAATSR